jgi:hypothetical protein
VSDAARDRHWESLRAERAAARAALVASLDKIEERARDPFRLKERMRKHPVLFTGIAAGAGALLVKMILGARDAAPAPPARDAGARSRDEAPDLLETLRDAALRVATPWVTRYVEEHFGRRDVADEVHTANGTDAGRPSV